MKVDWKVKAMEKEEKVYNHIKIFVKEWRHICTYEAGSDQPDGLRGWEALWVERVEDVVGEGQGSDGVP